MFNKWIKIILLLVFVVLMVSACSNNKSLPSREDIIPDFIVGFDGSEAKAIEDAGVRFKDLDGTEKPALQIMKDHGYTWFRIRIHVDPADGLDGNYGLFQDLEYVKAMTKEADRLGMNILLNFHYSHEWADPGRQTIPPRWQDKSVEELAEAVYEHTYETLAALKAQGTLPKIVQIGNETRGGMLWPYGKYWGEAAGGSWENYIKFHNAGVKAVRDISEDIKIMVHNDQGGSWDAIDWFYSEFEKQGGEYDVIGLSYYAMWHGTFEDLTNTITNAINKFAKDVYVVETAWYWDESDAGYNTSVVDYPTTPEGQYQFLYDLRKVVEKAGARGIFYWGSHWCQSEKWLTAPDWKDDDASRRSLFDDNAQATLGIKGLVLEE